MWISLFGAITVIFVLSVIWVSIQQWARNSDSQAPNGCDLPEASPLGCGHCTIAEMCSMRDVGTGPHRTRTTRKDV